jgi:hypothetical protein
VLLQLYKDLGQILWLRNIPARRHRVILSTYATDWERLVRQRRRSNRPGNSQAKGPSDASDFWRVVRAKRWNCFAKVPADGITFSGKRTDGASKAFQDLSEWLYARCLPANAHQSVFTLFRCDKNRSISISFPFQLLFDCHGEDFRLRFGDLSMLQIHI